MHLVTTTLVVTCDCFHILYANEYNSVTVMLTKPTSSKHWRNLWHTYSSGNFGGSLTETTCLLLTYVLNAVDHTVAPIPSNNTRVTLNAYVCSCSTPSFSSPANSSPANSRLLSVWQSLFLSVCSCYHKWWIKMNIIIAITYY